MDGRFCVSILRFAALAQNQVEKLDNEGEQRADSEQDPEVPQVVFAPTMVRSSPGQGRRTKQDEKRQTQTENAHQLADHDLPPCSWWLLILTLFLGRTREQCTP